MRIMQDVVEWTAMTPTSRAHVEEAHRPAELPGVPGPSKGTTVA
jgi:hypothetical protein